MNIAVEFVPEWAAGDDWPARQTSFLSKSIETTTDVNNYYKAQWDFFSELNMLNIKSPQLINPLYIMGATSVAEMWTMLMSTADLAHPSSTYDPRTAYGRNIIHHGLAGTDRTDGDCEHDAVDMSSHIVPYLYDDTNVFKQYVRFATSEDEKTIFINMRNDVLPSDEKNWFHLSSDNHIEYRTCLIEALFTFLRGVVTINGAKGDARLLVSRYPTLSHYYNYFLSYGY